MDAPLLDPSADGPAPAQRPPFFSGRATAVYTLLALGLVTLFLHLGSGPPLGGLERPEESLARLVGREMDFRHAVGRGPRWERRLYAILSVYEEDLEEPIRWYEELAEAEDSVLVHLYRGILLAEAGATSRLGPILAWLAAQGQAGARMAAWLGVAYLGERPDEAPGKALPSEIHRELPSGWFADRLVGRVASALGDASAQAEAESAIRARGEALVSRWRGLLAAEAVLFALGALAAWLLIARGPPPRVGAAPIPPPWRILDGCGLFVRGAVGFLGVSAVITLGLPPETPALAVATLASGAPMLWWTQRYLAAGGSSLAEAFGLRPAVGTGRALAGATLVLIGLSIAGEALLAAILGAFPLRVHWSEGLSEVVLWGPPWLVLAETLDSSLWTPLVEEIGFRGILYGALRSRLGVWPAAGLSALVFGLVHGYGAVGFAAVAWSGLLWALAYERTRSLLPGVLAHAVNNLMVTVAELLLLRL